MTETQPKPDHFKDFVKYRDKVAELEDIVGRALNGSTSDEKTAYRKKYVKLLSEEIRPDFDYGNGPEAEQDRFNDYQAHVNTVKRNSNDTLGRNLDEIVDKLDNKVLDNILKMNTREKPLVIPTNKLDPAITQRYSLWQQALGRKQAFESGELDSKGQEEVRMEVARMYAQESIEKLKKKDKEKGLLKDDQWYVEHQNLTYVGAIKHLKEEKFEKIALGMLDKSVKIAKKEYDTFTQEKGRNVYSMIRDSVKYFAKQGGKQFEEVADSLYQAKKMTGK